MTKLLTSGILFSTAVNTVAVAVVELVILGILLSISVTDFLFQIWFNCVIFSFYNKSTSK